MKKLCVVSILCMTLLLVYINCFFDDIFNFLRGDVAAGSLGKTIWCMIYLPVWGFCMYLYDLSWRQAQMVIHRYSFLLKWWNKTGLDLFGFVLKVYLIWFFEIGILYLSDMNWEKINILGGVLLQAWMLLFVGILMCFFVKNRVYAGVLLVVFEFCFGGKGIYLLPHPLIIFAIVFACLFFLFPTSRKKILIRKLAYEKND